MKPTTLQKAAIIIPPLHDFYITPHRISMLGVQVLKQVLLHCGIDACIIDGFDKGRRSNTLQLPKSLSYLKEHIIANETGRSSYFTRFRHFGRSYSDIVAELVRCKPDICFISCFAFCYGEPVVELAHCIKRRLPDLPVVAGGAGVSVHPEFFLRSASIDYTLCGEAEICLPLFVKYLKDGAGSERDVPGLGWKDGNRFFIRPIDRITDSENMHIVMVKTSEGKNRTAYTTSLSRGCPASCRFCSNHLTHGKKFRHGTVERFERLLDGLPDVLDEHEVTVNFEDDNLLHDYSFFRSVLDLCNERFGRFSFTAENGMDYRLLTVERMEELIRAGCRQFNFTIGSLSEHVLKLNDRTSAVERYDELLTVADKYNCPVISYVICGFPDDTKESIAEGLRFPAQRKTVIGLSLFYPVPGLPGFDKKEFYDTVVPQCCTGAAAYKWGTVDPGTLITAFRLARFCNLVKSSDVSVEERELITRTLNTKRLHTVIKERKERRIIEVPYQDVELVETVVPTILR